MNRMHPIFFFLLLFSQVVGAVCDKCQRPRIITYDCTIVPPRPSDTTDPALVQKIQSWRNLFWAAAGMQSYLMNDDPTKDCFTHIDGAFFTKGDTASNKITFGNEWTNLPPANGTSGGDYLVTGIVDGTEGNYSLVEQLKVAKTGELVSSASTSFAKSTDAINAGQTCAASLGPILNKIRAFEKKKRATGDPYAMQPTAELHPEKTTINKGESVKIELWLYDCDGDITSSPLANRPVQLSATCGTLSSSTVTTGSDGKAVVTFTAGNTPAEALVQAIYPFRLASEFESASDGGSVSIKVTPIPSTLWSVTGTMYKSNDLEETTSTEMTGLSEYSHQKSHNEDNFKVNAVIRNISQDSNVIFDSDSLPLSLQITGSHIENENDNSYTFASTGWIKNWCYKTATCTPKESEDSPKRVDFSFYNYPSSQSSRSLSISGYDMKGPANQRGKKCNSVDGCTDDNYDDDAVDQLDIYVGVLENDSDYVFDTTYTSEISGELTKATARKYIRKVGDSFVIHSYASQTDESSAVPGATKGQSFSTFVSQVDFVIAPLGKNPSIIKKLLKTSRNSKFVANVTIRNGSAEIQYVTSSAGKLKAELYDLHGRLLFRGDNINITANSNSIKISPQHLLSNSLICAKLTFTSDDGKIHIATGKVQLITP